jgi:hypothetical protein
MRRDLSRITHQIAHLPSRRKEGTNPRACVRSVSPDNRDRLHDSFGLIPSIDHSISSDRRGGSQAAMNGGGDWLTAGTRRLGRAPGDPAPHCFIVGDFAGSLRSAARIDSRVKTLVDTGFGTDDRRKQTDHLEPVGQANPAWRRSSNRKSRGKAHPCSVIADNRCFAHSSPSRSRQGPGFSNIRLLPWRRAHCLL